MGGAAIARAGRALSLSVAFRHEFSGLSPGFSVDIDFSVPEIGTTVLFGRSGCGKSTIVNAVAGLLRPVQGRISLGGTVLVDTETGIFLPPERRRIGLVFQDARLFPHMSVDSNLRYGLRRAPQELPTRGLPTRELAARGSIRFDDVVELLGLTGLLSRRPHSLSGGERQRVAIGRALLSQPLMLAMDEPLASLDAQRRAEILPYLARLRRSLKLPILYVTHSLDEVARLADTLVLIRAGRVLAAGPLPALLGRADLPLARRDDAASVLPARVVAHDPARQLTELAASGRRLLVPLLDAPPGHELRVRIPAREVILAAEEPRGISVHNIIPGAVHAVVADPARHAAMVEIALEDATLLARVTPDAVARLGLVPGAPVLALVKSVAIEVLAD